MGHLSGWQWLFLAEGVPSILLGVVALLYFPERPGTSHWLAPEQRAALSARIDREQPPTVAASDTLSRALSNPLVWVLAVPYFVLNAVSYAFVLWGPILVREVLGTTNLQTGLILGLISLTTALVYVVSAYLSDRWDARCSSAALGLALQFAGCLGMALLPNSVFRLLSLTLIPIGGMVMLAPFWCLPTRFLKGTAAAAGIALISAIGSSGGFFGPTIVGFFRESTGGNARAFWGLAGLALLGTALCMGLGRMTLFRPARPLAAPRPVPSQ
jgi:MFS transporter, ACS family, tartrate transporter